MSLSNHEVVIGFMSGEKVRSKNLSVCPGVVDSTDRYLVSYGVPIARRSIEDDESIRFRVWDYRGKWKLSVTTTRHVGLVLSNLFRYEEVVDVHVPTEDEMSSAQMWMKAEKDWRDSFRSGGKDGKSD